MCLHIEKQFLFAPLQLTARVLSDTHIQLLSHKLNMDDMYRLAVKLDISPEDVEADFAKFCTNKTVVIHNTLDQWMKGQDSREEAYRKLVEALIHPDVGLNLLAREVLGYTIITSDLLTNRKFPYWKYVDICNLNLNVIRVILNYKIQYL